MTASSRASHAMDRSRAIVKSRISSDTEYDVLKLKETTRAARGEENGTRPCSRCLHLFADGESWSVPFNGLAPQPAQRHQRHTKSACPEFSAPQSKFQTLLRPVARASMSLRCNGWSDGTRSPPNCCRSSGSRSPAPRSRFWRLGTTERRLRRLRRLRFSTSNSKQCKSGLILLSGASQRSGPASSTSLATAREVARNEYVYG